MHASYLLQSLICSALVSADVESFRAKLQQLDDKYLNKGDADEREAWVARPRVKNEVERPRSSPFLYNETPYGTDNNHGSHPSEEAFHPSFLETEAPVMTPGEFSNWLKTMYQAVDKRRDDSISHLFVDEAN